MTKAEEFDKARRLAYKEIFHWSRSYIILIVRVLITEWGLK